MKKFVLALSALSIYAVACDVTVTNDTPYSVSVENLSNKKTYKLNSFDSKQITQDQRANINLVAHGIYGSKPHVFHLKQIACSQTHKIDIPVQGVLNNQFNDKHLFEISKGKK